MPNGEGSGPKRPPEGEVPLATQPEAEAPQLDVRRRLMGALNHQMVGELVKIRNATTDIELFQVELPEKVPKAIAQLKIARQRLEHLVTSFSVILANAGDAELLEEVWRNMGRNTKEQAEFFSDPKRVSEVKQEYRDRKEKG